MNFTWKLIQWSHLSKCKSQEGFEINLNDFKLQNGNLFHSQHVSFVFRFSWKERQTFPIEFQQTQFHQKHFASLLSLLLEFFKADAQSNFHNFGFTPRITLAWFPVLSFSFLSRFSISCRVWGSFEGPIFQHEFWSHICLRKKMIRPLMVAIINSNYSR